MKHSPNASSIKSNSVISGALRASYDAQSRKNFLAIEDEMRKSQEELKPTNFGSNGLYKSNSWSRLSDVNRIFNDSIHNSQKYIIGQGKVQLNIGKLEPYS